MLFATTMRAPATPATPVARRRGPMLQRRCACGGMAGPTGECDSCRRKREARERHDHAGASSGFAAGSRGIGVQPKLRINQPGDALEREADRVADAVVSGRDPTRPGAGGAASLQRQEAQPGPATTKVPTQEETYKKAGEKLLEGIRATPEWKQVEAELSRRGKEFAATTEGKALIGTALAGALAAVIATNSDLPAQVPELPLDFISPGLKATLTWEGPVRAPTNVALTVTTAGGIKFGAGYSNTPAKDAKPAEQKFGLTFSIPLGGSATKSKAPAPSSDTFRAGTARMAAEQAKFREGLKSPEERARDEAFWQSYWRSQIRDPLGLPGQSRPVTPPTESPPERKPEDAPLQRKPAGEAGPAHAGADAPPIVHGVLQSAGRPLEASTRAFMESRLGHDFSSVRIHADEHAAASADAVRADAYTVGQQIVFARGKYAPSSPDGRRLLAHELAHTVQQGHVAATTGAAVQRKVANNVVDDFQPGAKACLVHIHGEEKTALAAGEELRRRRCVNFMHLDTRERAIAFDFKAGGVAFTAKADPNRIFTDAGRRNHAIVGGSIAPDKSGVPAADIKAAAVAELETFANDVFLPKLADCRAASGKDTGELPVLALHNNEGLQPEKFKSSADPARSPNPAKGDRANPNDFFFVNQAADFDALAGHRNVVLQENPVQAKNDDGSLSVLLAGQRYLNVEKEGRNHAGPVKRGGFTSRDDVYVKNYDMAAEALDLLGVPDMPCGSSKDFGARTKSLFNRRLGQSGRTTTRLSADRTMLERDPLPDPAPKGCLLFKDQPALDRRADEWRTKIDRLPLENTVEWMLGGKFEPPDPLAEFKAQQTCLIAALRTAEKSQGLTVPRGGLVKSEKRGFADQKSIWARKFAFTGGPFDRISDEARKKCPSLPAGDGQWNPRDTTHAACWATLSADEKQKEILMASSAPGISRHHAGVDFDFGQTDRDLDAKEWTGAGRFADSYRWLARNASTYGFIQPFDTQGGYGKGYMAERWHWSYYPVAVALMEFAMDHEAEIEATLQMLWGDGKGGIKPEFSFIAKNWRSYLYNVEAEGTF